MTGKELWRNEVIPHPDGPGDETWRGIPFENRWCTGVWGQIVYDPVTPMRPNPGAKGMLAANLNISKSRVRALVGMPCKNPVFWALQAQTGKFFYARETFRGAQNLYKSIDPVTGLATMNQDVVYDRPNKRILYCTSHSGGRDAHVAPAYDPTRNIHDSSDR